MYRIVGGGVMGLTLILQELVNCCDRGGIVGDDPDLPATGAIGLDVADLAAPRRHYGGAGHRLGVNLLGHGEVPVGERGRDRTEMRPDGRHAGAVSGVAHQNDAPAVGKRFEYVTGAVLDPPP